MKATHGKLYLTTFKVIVGSSVSPEKLVKLSRGEVSTGSLLFPPIAEFEGVS